MDPVKRWLEAFVEEGAENVVLAQRDGAPVESAGSWASTHDIFLFSAMTTHVFAMAERLFEQPINYLLLEGEMGKVVIASVQKAGPSLIETGYFMAFATGARVHLPALFRRMAATLATLGQRLETSKFWVHPSLRPFPKEEMQEILVANHLTEGQISSPEEEAPIELSPEKTADIIKAASDCIGIIPENRWTSVLLEGGKLVCRMAVDPPIRAKEYLHYFLLQYSMGVLCLLKKGRVRSVIFETATLVHTTYYLSRGIFVNLFLREAKYLGLYRLVIAKYGGLLRGYLEDALRESLEDLYKSHF